MATPVLVNGVTGVLATAINVRGQTCNVTAFHIHNPSTGAAYVLFYDSAVAPTVGTTVASWAVGVGTISQTNLAFSVPGGLFFRDGLWVAATTTNGGTGAPGTALQVSLAMS